MKSKQHTADLSWFVPTLTQLSGATQARSAKRFFAAVLVVVIVMAAIAIVQDFLHSARHGSAFFFSESLLFKTVWLFFPPILLLLRHTFETRKVTGKVPSLTALIAATMVHLLCVPSTIWLLSTLFREQAYGFGKVLSFTLANDSVVLLLVYGAFILWLRLVQVGRAAAPSRKPVRSPEWLTIKSGKQHDRIRLSDILYVKSASPYIAIHVQGKHYLHGQSLKAIEKCLGDRFVRVHKSSIVNLNHVASYQSRLNGDYDLTLSDGMQLRLSRNYVGSFKERMQATPQLAQ